MMIERKIFVLAMFIIALVAISAVSAADTQTADLATDDVQAIEIESMETLSEGNDAGTFTQLRNDISAAGNNNILTLDRNYEDDGTGVIDFSNSNLTIDGRGHKIDAKNQTGIFLVREGNVTIKNITFTNSQGTAIKWYGDDGKITGCNFINNTAGSSGGAIYWFANGASVSGCSFIGNTAEEGGAIYGVQSRAHSIINCSFMDNKAMSGGGGAIMMSDVHMVSVFDCNFMNNTAMSGDGGAINMMDGQVSGCSFANNSAGCKGGVIYCHQADDSSVSDCSFVNSCAKDGGAIYFFYCGGFSVSNCDFANSTAKEGSGGVIYWIGDGGSVSDCVFANSYAQTSGGVIYWTSSDGQFSGSVKHCIFVNSTARSDGGVICWLGSYANISSCSFMNSYGNNGGAIHIRGYSCSVSDCNIVNTSSEGAIIYFSNPYTGHRDFRVNNNIFLSNNDCCVISFYQRQNGDNSNIDYNWFGNVAGNYEDMPTFNNINPNNWLFLNGTANPKTISFAETASVMFNLYSYDPISGNISEYNNISFANLTLASNGNLDKITAGFGEAVKFTPASAGTGRVTASIANEEYVVEFSVMKSGTELTSAGLTTAYNKNDYLVVTLKDSNGKAIGSASITVYLNGAKTYATDKNGQVKIPTKALVPNKYEVKITFAENANFNASSATAKVIVKKATPKLVVKAKSFKKTLNAKKYSVTLKDNLAKVMKNTKVTLKVKGKTYAAKTNSKGKATFKLTKLTKKGTFKATVTYKGNKYFNKVAKKVKIKVR